MSNHTLRHLTCRVNSDALHGRIAGALPPFDHDPRSGRYRDAVTLADKLHPDRFSDMSGRMAAVIGYVLGESWAKPEIAWLSVTPDGHVISDSAMVGVAADLDRNLLNLLIAADLTDEERTDFERRYRERVDDWRPVLAGPMPATDRLTRPDFGATAIKA